MEFPETICGYSRNRVRDMFQAFVNRETPMMFVDGDFKSQPKRFTLDEVCSALDVSSSEASRVIACLTTDGWLRADRAIPTHKAMALTLHIDRPRLPRAEADKLLADVIAWAEKANSRSDFKIKINRLDVFGSYLDTTPDVGDLDIVVAFNMQELLDSFAFEPEHHDEIDELLDELRSISEYVSPTDELDKLAMSDVTYKTVFRR